jgi:pilus assembly protein CpaC
VNIWTKDHGAAAVRSRHQDRISVSDDGRAISRWRSFLLSLLAALMIVVGSPLLPEFVGKAVAEKLIQVGTNRRTTAVSVAVGKSEDVRTDVGFVDVLVGDPEIADVNPLTDRAISILGKKIGTTRVSIYGEGKRLIGVFDVEVSYDVSTLAIELAHRFPRAKLRVSAVNGRIMLAGYSPDAIVMDEALAIARQFGPDVINAVEVAQPQQVMLEVRFVEASRKAGRDLGLQWNVNSTNGRFLTNIGDIGSSSSLPVPAGTIASAGVLSGATPFGFTAAKLLGFGMEADVMINALETKGLARRLAEPNLVALSGDTASFLAGGEYPIPIVGSFGQVSVDYKRYGVSLAFTPTVLGGGLINLKIVPEVSELDPSHSVPVSAGSTTIAVPALTVRRASSTIELKDGQSFVLAGLLQNELSTAQQQIPWIGDVPVLGALFSSKDYQKNETDLVIIVTPRVIHPTRPGDPVKTPLDSTLPANDVDFFLNNQPEVLRTEVRATEETFGRSGLSGHMIDLPKVELRAPAPVRAEFNAFDVSTWGLPRVAAAPKRETPQPDAPKVETQVLDTPKLATPAADPTNGESQVLDLPKGDSHAAL